MEERTVVKSYLHAVWETTLQRILTMIEIAGLVGLFISVIDGWLEFIYALVFITFWLSGNYLIFKRQQERIKQLEDSLASEQKLISATRSLLSDEITQNLEAFKIYWEKINRLKEASNDPIQKRLASARQAIDLPLPTWGCTIWETQTSLLAKAISTQQLQKVQVINGQFKEISAIYSKLQALMDEQQENLRADRWSDGGPMLMGVVGPPLKFDKNAPMLWDSLELIAHRLISEGNPL